MTHGSTKPSKVASILSKIVPSLSRIIISAINMSQLEGLYLFSSIKYLGGLLSGTLVKIIIGAVLLAVSVWWIVQGSSYIQPFKDSSFVAGRPALADFITLINGGSPPFFALIGLLIIWLEWDNMKIKKELSEQEKKTE